MRLRRGWQAPRGNPPGRPYETGPESRAEYDSPAVERTVFEVIWQVAERFGPPRSIGVASVAESGFLVDSSGEPLAPAIAWLSGRMEPQATRWKKRLDPLGLFTRTELHLAPRCTACKLEWRWEKRVRAVPVNRKGSNLAARDSVTMSAVRPQEGRNEVGKPAIVLAR